MSQCESAYSFITPTRFIATALPPRATFAVFAVYFDGLPATHRGQPIEHASLQAASDRADEIAEARGYARERFDIRRIWL